MELLAPIPEAPQYSVTEDGKGVLKVQTGKWLSIYFKGGRPFVRLGTSLEMSISHVVASAWIGPRPSELFVLHKDDNPENNHFSNLYYGTLKQNKEDERRNRVKRGLTPSNETKIKVPEDVKAIRQSRDSQSLLAEKYGISQYAISLIKRRKSYSWVE